MRGISDASGAAPSDFVFRKSSGGRLPQFDLAFVCGIRDHSTGHRHTRLPFDAPRIQSFVDAVRPIHGAMQ